jgi:putative ABC transport system ATP-binding protein
MRDASVWLFDEPTRSLDADAETGTWTLIRQLVRHRGATALVATHDADAVRAFADQVVALP